MQLDGVSPVHVPGLGSSVSEVVHDHFASCYGGRAVFTQQSCIKLIQVYAGLLPVCVWGGGGGERGVERER